MQEVQKHLPSISTHAPRTGSDLIVAAVGFLHKVFQPTLPARGATNSRAQPGERRNISTHAPRTGSDEDRHGAGLRPAISTHAPRTGSDAHQLLAGRRHVAISTHAPRTGSDLQSACQFRSSQFQPTLPARGATCTGRAGSPPAPHFNPRSPHGERRAPGSTPRPARISTHAPRTGSDTSSDTLAAAQQDFNPRSPHGERPPPRRSSKRRRGFQPTLPARGATKEVGFCEAIKPLFQPTLPARGATR